MNEADLRKLLQQVRGRRTSVNATVKQLGHMPFESLDFATVDHHRALRCGFPEVIYCPGKTTQQVLAIAARLLSTKNNLLATRAEPALYRAFRKKFPNARYDALARCITVRKVKATPSRHAIAIVSAGTSDLPVAEEARVTAEIMDQRTRTFYDVGVAGIHRLLVHAEALREAKVVIVVAGMEGALPSVVGGLVDAPVVAVPTSVGYGASFQGVAPLLTMLNSCAVGVSVVNIDNGFAAGYIAARINRIAEGTG
jgi:NCAIR mutase (PurE)-related protein